MNAESLRARLPMAALAGSTVAAWTALPEYVSGRWTRFAARGGLLAASSLGVVLLDEDPTPQPRRDEKMAAISRAMDDPAQRAAIWIIVLVALSTVSNVENTLLDRAARSLQARGASAPRTVLGLGLGAIAAGTQLAPSPTR